MPTATVSGMVLGWLVQRRINKYRKPPSGLPGYALTMAIGAVVANAVVASDIEFQRRKQEYIDQRRHDDGGGDGDGDGAISPAVKSL